MYLRLIGTDDERCDSLVFGSITLGYIWIRSQDRKETNTLETAHDREI